MLHDQTSLPLPLLLLPTLPLLLLLPLLPLLLLPLLPLLTLPLFLTWPFHSLLHLVRCSSPHSQGNPPSLPKPGRQSARH